MTNAQAEDLQGIKYIHVAGTKGKGTTCLYCERILHEYQTLKGFPKKIACLTSPHVSDVRDRIRINSEPISKVLFTDYFFEVWNKMLRLSEPEAASSASPPIPGYPGFLTLLAFYIFARERVNVAVIETGIGGERDSTNFIQNPSATGITALGLDHTNVLGSNISDIAWHKAGIFKPNVPAFTVEQDPIAFRTLQTRALEKSASLHIVQEEAAKQFGVHIQPDLPYQWRNASLALSLAETYLRSIDREFQMSQKLAKSLELIVLPGRCEVLVRGRQTWLISVAHDSTSILETCNWLKLVLRQSKYV